jgi:hypothetical protein
MEIGFLCALLLLTIILYFAALSVLQGVINLIMFIFGPIITIFLYIAHFLSIIVLYYAIYSYMFGDSFGLYEIFFVTLDSKFQSVFYPLWNITRTSL